MPDRVIVQRTYLELGDAVAAVLQVADDVNALLNRTIVAASVMAVDWNATLLRCATALPAASARSNCDVEITGAPVSS